MRIFVAICLIASFAFADDVVVKTLGRGELKLAENILLMQINSGEIEAIYRLGFILTSQYPPSSQEFIKGISLLEEAAAKEYRQALSALAGIYLQGDGVEKNPAKARMLYAKAAELGDGEGQFNLGILFKNGEGGTKNLKGGLFYLSLAASNKEDLGELCEDAAFYRDEIAKDISSQERMQVLQALSYVKSANRPYILPTFVYSSHQR